MEISDFDFELPSDLIAQEPLTSREASRMRVVDRRRGEFTDRHFVEFPELLDRSDLLVLNNTRVFTARLFGRNEGGARVEIFLVEEIGPRTWLVLGRPGKRLRAGKRVDFDERLSGQVVEKRTDGRIVVQFDPGPALHTTIDEIGRTPLPPYIRRDSERPDPDRDRYQTVFASRRGAIAAPTAGLHFSNEILGAIADRGVETAEVTLHVGYGTFEPVRADELSRHSVAPERFEIGGEAAEKLEKARRERRRIVAVGTTTTRTLEYAVARDGAFRAQAGDVDLTILPGYKFKAVGALLTNFHLPKSSLLILVATFAGHKLIMDSYRHAVESRYRFYSYGDCTFIV